MRKTLPKTTADHWMAKFPALQRSEAYRRHWMRLVFGTSRDEEGLLRCGRDEVLRDLGMTDAQARATRTTAESFLESFAREMRLGERYQVIPYVPGEYTRRIRFALDAADKDLVMRERAGELAGERVYFDDLHPYTYRTHRRRLEAEVREAEDSLPGVECEASQKVIRYFLEVPTNRLAALVRENLQSARGAASALSSEQAREQAHRLLDAVAEGQPLVYSPSPLGCTARVFGGGGLQGLKREVRAALLAGTWELDVANAHLAVAAARWHVEELYEYLREGRSIWDDLLPWLVPSVERGTLRWVQVKEIVKDFVYGLVYGMARTRIRRELGEALAAVDIERGGERFLAHWMVEGILSARERVATEIELRGYAEDAFGKRIPLERRADGDNTLSIMAEVCQSWELRIVLPLLEWLQEHQRSASALVYAFDGLTVAVSREREEERVKRELSDVFRRTVAALGIPTRLEWKRNHFIREASSLRLSI